jgi:hypothetical protein
LSYLAIARAVVTGYERNESNEESPDRLSVADAERLKARIIAAVDVEPADFDRAEYDRLWTRWKAHEAAGASPRHNRNPHAPSDTA